MGESKGRYASRGLLELKRPNRFKTFPVLTDEERRRMKRAVQETLQRVKQIMLSRKRARAITAIPEEKRLTLAQWEAIKRRYRYRCAYCFKPHPLTKDHVIPLTKGGLHCATNVIPACRSCNSRKGARPANDYNPLQFRGPLILR